VEDSKSGAHALGTGGSVGAKIGQSDPSSEEIFSNSTAFVKRMVRFAWCPSILAFAVIWDRDRTRFGASHEVTRFWRRALLTYSALISLGASLLAACSGQWPYLPWQFSAPQSQASVSPPPSRPMHKHKPPATTDTSAPDASGEVLARAEPAPAIPAPAATSAFTPPGPAGPPSPDAQTTHSPLPQPSELVGLDQPEVTRLLGAAAEQFERPPAMVWRYKNATCELDLFFYLDLHSNRLRTLHYAVKGDGGNPARRQDCLESLRVARSN